MRSNWRCCDDDTRLSPALEPRCILSSSCLLFRRPPVTRISASRSAASSSSSASHAASCATGPQSKQFNQQQMQFLKFILVFQNHWVTAEAAGERGAAARQMRWHPAASERSCRCRLQRETQRRCLDGAVGLREEGVAECHDASRRFGDILRRKRRFGFHSNHILP